MSVMGPGDRPIQRGRRVGREGVGQADLSGLEEPGHKWERECAFPLRHTLLSHHGHPVWVAGEEGWTGHSQNWEQLCRASGHHLEPESMGAKSSGWWFRVRR